MVDLIKNKGNDGYVLETTDAEGFHKQLNLTYEDLGKAYMKMLTAIPDIWKWKYLRKFGVRVAKTFAISFIYILQFILLVIAFAVGKVVGQIIKAIRKKPCVSVFVTFALMLVVAITIHMEMKTKLTTSEYQKYLLEQKLDSINSMKSGSLTYYKYQPYKAD